MTNSARTRALPVRALRRFHRARDGQAMALAAVAALAVALGVTATVSIGQAIHKKIHVQNIADTASYSLAVVEARTFNFWAFTNRAQVSLYNSMMYANTLITELTANQMYFGTQRDAYLTAFAQMDFLWHTTPAPWNSGFLPGHVAALFAENVLRRALAELWIGTLMPIVDQLLGAMAIPATWELVKWGLYGSQQLLGLGLQTYIATGMWGMIKRSDPHSFIDWNVSSLITTAMNEVEFLGLPFGGRSKWGVTDRTASGVPGLPVFGWSALRDPQGATQPEDKRARMAMADVVMASRNDDFVPNHSDLWGGGSGTTGVIDTKPSRMQACDSKVSKLRDSAARAGDVMVSDHLITTRFPRRISANAMVAADARNGSHLSWTAVQFQDGNSPQFSVAGCQNVQEETTNHPYYGIAPYMKFNPVADALKDFNQPSTWTLLNIPPEKMENVYTMRFRYGDASDQANIDWRVGKDGILNSGLLPGVTALSRGQVYYHRPEPQPQNPMGYWAEHPNFFNPYWNARLAPVGEKLQQMISGGIANMNLSPDFSGFLNRINQLVVNNTFTH